MDCNGALGSPLVFFMMELVYGKILHLNTGYTFSCLFRMSARKKVLQESAVLEHGTGNTQSTISLTLLVPSHIGGLAKQAMQFLQKLQTFKQ
jgi:hypothetical protein